MNVKRKGVDVLNLFIHTFGIISAMFLAFIGWYLASGKFEKDFITRATGIICLILAIVLTLHLVR